MCKTLLVSFNTSSTVYHPARCRGSVGWERPATWALAQEERIPQRTGLLYPLQNQESRDLTYLILKWMAKRTAIISDEWASYPCI
ncbi:hypothetical protein HZS_6599 [Henneguya salminicola]|nr:hypothetical protein HZS_6599 [Henneguya salminicola]